MNNTITDIFVQSFGKKGEDFYRAYIEYVDNATGEILVGITDYYSKGVLEMVVEDAMANYYMAKLLRIEGK